MYAYKILVWGKAFFIPSYQLIVLFNHQDHETWDSFYHQGFNVLKVIVKTQILYYFDNLKVQNHYTSFDK